MLMSSISTIAARSPQIGRRKRPIRHGVYLRKGERALKVQANDVKRLMRAAVDAFPWLREENLPTLRKWAEIEVIRRAAFAGILTDGIVFKKDAKTKEISLKRLVDEHRKLCMSQAVLEEMLLMTPRSRAQLADCNNPTDLVALMAAQTEEPPAEDPRDDQPPLEDPPPDKESPTEPGSPSPMKS